MRTIKDTIEMKAKGGGKTGVKRKRSESKRANKDNAEDADTKKNAKKKREEENEERKRGGRRR